MGFFKNLIRHIKGSELVEKIIMVAFSVAMGAAVIAYTVGVINTNKDLQYAGSATFVMSTDGDFGSGNVASKNDIAVALTNGSYSKYDSYIGMNSGAKLDISSQKERINKVTFEVEENENYPASFEVITASTGSLDGLVWSPDSTVYSVQFTKPSGKQVKLKTISIECATSTLNFIDYDLGTKLFTTSSNAGWDSSFTKTEDGITLTFDPHATGTDKPLQSNHIRVYQGGSMTVASAKPIKEIRIGANITTKIVFDWTPNAGDLVNTTWYSDNNGTYEVTFTKPASNSKQTQITSVEIVYINGMY